MCFLFSKFESVTYYTGCKGAEGKEFLQVSRRNWRQPSKPVLKKVPKVVVAPNYSLHAGRISTTGCFAKLEDFDGTNLTPDPKGENKHALNKLVEAERCPKGVVAAPEPAAAEPSHESAPKSVAAEPHHMETVEEILHHLHDKPHFR
jgi:hypothetical protein